MSIVLALGLSFLSGYLVVSAAWPGEKANNSERWMKLFLSAGFGIGIFSIAFFVERWLGIIHILATDLCLITLLLATYLVTRARRKSENLIASRFPDVKFPTWLHRLLMASLAISILAALYATVLRALAHPHGDGWDAFAIWNLHARFLFLGGSHWRDGLSALIPWSHPDYPPLVPAAIAHVWSYIGHDDPIVPAIVSLIFTFATLGLLISSLATLRGFTSAAMAGTALASTPFFIEQGAAQYADIPLSFFFLAAIAFLSLYQQRSAQTSDGTPIGFLMLAGIATGYAAWTKNEGLLFLFAFLVSHIASVAWRTRPRTNESRLNSVRKLVIILFATTPFLLLILWFKHSIAPSGDLFSSSGTVIHKILTPGRYWAILRWYGKDLLRFGNWVVPTTILFIALRFLSPSAGIRRQDTAFRSSVLTLALTLCGYFAVFVITPNELYWHLRFSLNRLFLQLWPAVIFLFFLYMSRQASSESGTEPDSGQKHANC